ncbi:hypothetical protein SDC9_198846 [bioreactor metagenome]|uniref:Uncharacterized protein n=1 Tax=bioreactor metagenome TaxID=1076179 RepID=A0A645IS28_9ZZZZ
MEFPGAIDAGGGHDIQIEGGKHVLPHEEHRHRRGDIGQDQRKKAIGHADAVHELVKADADDLGRDHHDGQDQCKERLPQPPAIGYQREGRQSGEIDGACR